MLRFLFTSFFVISLFLPAAFSQGTITGRITDAKTKEAVIGAAVILENTQLGSITDADGNYSIANIPAGKYNLVMKYVGYENKVMKDIVVKRGETQTINSPIGSEEKEIKEVTVTSNKVHNTESAIVTEIRKENSIACGISSQQIQKGQDRNAADIVRRIPGVTIIEGRFINIRGLKERYNNVWINDAAAPSTEADKRAFSFDVIPAGMIERIMIYKTPSPELPGDFAGGMVKIYTQSIPEKSTVLASYSTSFRDGSTFKPFHYTDGSKTDMLGYDNGFRAIPAGTPSYINHADSNNNAITKAFKNIWGIHTANALPDQRANLALLGVLKLKVLTIGNTTALSYTRTQSTYFQERADYDSSTQYTAQYDTLSTRQVTAGLMENLAFRFGKNQIELKGFLNQTGKEQTTMRGEYFNDVNKRFYAEYYQARTIALGQLMGNHKFETPHDKICYEYTLSYAYGNRNEPDFRRIKYAMSIDSIYHAQIAPSIDPVNGGGRLFSNLKEQTYSFSHSLKQHFIIGKGVYEFDVNFGNYIEYKSREFTNRTLGYVLPTGPGALQDAYYLRTLPLDSIFMSYDSIYIQDTKVKKKFAMDETTNKSDAYQAQNLQIASYICFNFPIGTRVKLVTGIRHEYNRQSLQSYLGTDSISPKIITNFFLPSVNLSVNLTENMLVRAAWGQTVNRPEFREWSPFYFYDFEFSAGNYGSLFPSVFYPTGTALKVAQIHNVDLRYEWYPDYGDMIHVGGFFKYFKDPIQQVITATGGVDSKAFNYINADHAYVYGVEIDLRKSLGFINKNSKHLFNCFSVVANAAYINSKLTLPALTNLTTTTKLQGQSPYVVNAGIYYQDDSLGIIGLQASLLYNVFGPRIYVLGNSGYPNIGEMAKNSLDFSLSVTFIRRISLIFSVQDIINNPTRLILDVDRNNKFTYGGNDKQILSYKTGRYYTVGLKFRL